MRLSAAFALILQWLFIPLALSCVALVYAWDDYFSPATRALLNWGALAVMIAMNALPFCKRHPFRLLFAMIATFLCLRYLFWRSFSTLTYEGPFDFLGMAAIYAAELHGILVFLFGIVINLWPLKRELQLVSGHEADLPTVDVFIPTYNEPEEIIRITAIAARAMDYPQEKLKVYILDDGATIERRRNPKTSVAAWTRHYALRRLARKVGATYITREANGHAKAGNLNHALSYTQGALILFLDCDHVPTRDFLRYTVGYFLKDPKLFLVQTPHFFINSTPVEKNLEKISSSSSVSVENDMFFRDVHAGLDFWNSSYFCGSAAVMRRSCLEEIGGIQGFTITEDAETSMNLHNRGYHSVYVNRPMVCGLSPETFDDYVLQRRRWARGMLQLLIKMNVLRMQGLSWSQKLCFFNSCFFWFFSVSRFVYYLGPAFFLLLGLKVYHASLSQIVIFALPYVLSINISSNFFFGGTRRALFSEIYESVQSPFIATEIIRTLINPDTSVFKVTPKGARNDTESLNRMARPFFFIIALNVFAISVGIGKWIDYPLYRDVILITGVWCLYNLVMASISLGAFWETRDVRRYHRITTSENATIVLSRTGERFPANLDDISLSGISLRFRGEHPPQRDDRVELIIVDDYAEDYHFHGTLRRVFFKGGEYRCGIDLDNLAENFDVYVKYAYSSSYRWHEHRELKALHGDQGTDRLLLHLLRLGFVGFFVLTKENAIWLLQTAKRLFQSGLSGKWSSA